MKKIALVLTMVFTFSGIYASTLKLQTIGAMGASALYLSYLSIGTVADGYSSKTYDEKRAADIVSEVLSIIKVNSNYLEKLISERELTGGDVQFARKMISTFKLLTSEGESFIRYTKSQSDEDIRQFHGYRKRAWALISELLNLKK
jgi:hypothetical protein